MRGMAPLINACADNLVTNMATVANTDKVIDLKAFLGSFATDVIASCAYGTQIDSGGSAGHPFATNAKKLFTFTWRVLLIVFFPGLAKLLKNVIGQDTSALDYFANL